MAAADVLDLTPPVIIAIMMKQKRSLSGNVGASQLREAILTATGRAENIQNVLNTIQALTGMERLPVQTLAYRLKYVPNVTTAAAGPGEANLGMNGQVIEMRKPMRPRVIEPNFLYSFEKH
jgi:hypothetical protein